MHTIGKRLKVLRIAKGTDTRGRPYTQRELAAAAGVDVSSINNIETCKAEPKWSTAIKLADFLGVTADELRDDKTDSDTIEARLIAASVRAQDGDASALEEVKRLARELASAEVERANAEPSRPSRTRKKTT